MSTEIHIEKSPKLAEVKLKYNCKQPVDDYPVINCPEMAIMILRKIWDLDTIQLKEEFVIILLNNGKRCLGWSKISSGGATSTIVDPATIFQIALLGNASSIIVAHNHPSGNIEPSASDKRITQRIIDSGKMLGINVDDHIILTADKSLSFKERNIL